MFPCWLKWVESAGGEDIPCRFACFTCFCLLLPIFFSLVLAIHVSVCFSLFCVVGYPFTLSQLTLTIVMIALFEDMCTPFRFFVSIFCLIFALVLSDIRQLVDLLCLMTPCSTVPFALVCCANTLFDMMRLE